MNRETVLSELQPLFDSVFVNAVQVSANLSAQDVDEWDSLTHISLLVAIEKYFKIRFRTGEVAVTNNVGELADLIARRIAEKA